MSAQLQTLPDGTEALVIVTGTNTEVITLDVIAAYSELFGEPDPVKTVGLIRGAMKTVDQSGMWKPLYENLSDGLGELAKAGVPPDLMPDVLEETTAPVPRDRAALRAARLATRTRLAKGSTAGAAEFGPLLTARLAKIKGHRAEFLKGITPPVPDPGPEVTNESPFIELQQDAQLVDQLPNE